MRRTRKISYSTGHVQPLHGRRAVAERLYAPTPRGVARVSAMLMDTALARMLSALAKTMAEERAAAWCARKDRGEARPCPYRAAAAITPARRLSTRAGEPRREPSTARARIGRRLRLAWIRIGGHVRCQCLPVGSRRRTQPTRTAVANHGSCVQRARRRCLWRAALPWTRYQTGVSNVPTLQAQASTCSAAGVRTASLRGICPHESSPRPRRHSLRRGSALTTPIQRHA